jgi:signal transduction histidine kinase
VSAEPGATFATTPARSRRRLVAALALALGFGLLAERIAFGADDVGRAAADFAVGAALVALGLVARDRRSESRVGGLMTFAGIAWFAGTLLPQAIYLHRGPLVHMHLSYPSGRLPTRLALVVTGAAYAVAVVEGFARSDVLTIVVSIAVAVAALDVFLRTSGAARKAAGPALAAALAFAGVLALAAIARLSGTGSRDAVLAVYELAIVAIALALFVDLLRGRWSDAVVTGLVVDLGRHAEPATVRATLARALADPTLQIGYPVGADGAYVDAAGQPLRLPGPGSGRTVTDVGDAVLVHDDAVLAEPALLESAAAAARLAIGNAALQAEVRARVDEVSASRRRIVEAADAQRRRLEDELRRGAERRLETVESLLASVPTTVGGGELTALRGGVAEARVELREFARGVHPAALGDGGLMPALARLADRSPVPVELHGAGGPLPGPIETAVYFVCSEALANAAKHARAASVRVDVRFDGARVAVSIADDGVGGAAPARGSGLRGLADRVEALGGRFALDSAPGTGTRLTAEIPVGPG